MAKLRRNGLQLCERRGLTPRGSRSANVHRQTRVEGRSFEAMKDDLSTQFIAACVPAQIKVKIEQTTRVAAWSVVQDRLLLVQRWQGTKIAELKLPNKTSKACALPLFPSRSRAVTCVL